METLLRTVELWALRCGCDDFQVATAQSLAWLYRKRLLDQGGQDFPAGHWARLAVRSTLSGRDLPDCGTGRADALSHSTLCGTMPALMDRTPPPDVLVDHKIRYEELMREISEAKKVVAAMRIEGWSNYEIAQALRVSPGRASQVAREIVEDFLASE